MVKFLKPNKAVIILQGRYAGRKAVIVKHFDDGTRDRPYGHCLVAGIKKYPSKVIRKDSAKKTAKKSRVKCFIKLVNYQHLMPTRYTLDVDLKDTVSPDCLTTKDKKVTACKETKARFEERFKTGKNRWFFTKLRCPGLLCNCGVAELLRCELAMDEVFLDESQLRMCQSLESVLLMWFAPASSCELPDSASILVLKVCSRRLCFMKYDDDVPCKVKEDIIRSAFSFSYIWDQMCIICIIGVTFSQLVLFPKDVGNWEKGVFALKFRPRGISAAGQSLVAKQLKFGVLAYLVLDHIILLILECLVCYS
ncbi:unnamed protein product [Dovyalis caffra]|uniref:KOW domain-containing protein n=1 Tax=Dovyalis caffra TaxID=77055 RepID=A0AAV1S529_9ROSI|nr:unnamed protein product [Dovyalis caffra]